MIYYLRSTPVGGMREQQGGAPVKKHRTWRLTTRSNAYRVAAALAAVALVTTACGGNDEGGESSPSPTDTGSMTDTGGMSETPTATDTGGGMSMADIKMDVGVTADPCPDGNPDHGCIYLGIISDFSGPFQTFGQPITEGQQAFWKRVNDEGGIGGMFDVALPDDLVADGQYNPQTTAAEYQRLEPQIAALGQTLGTPQTEAILDSMKSDNVIAATLTWWSGWEFEDNIVESGSNYCMDAMNGVDWMLEQGDTIGSILHVGFPGDYGGDARAGVNAAAEANGITVLDPVDQTPIAAGGNVTEAVTAIVGQNPDVVFLTVGPQEAGQIIGGAAQQGYQGKFLGSHPVFLPDLMASAAAPAIQAMLTVVAPHEGYDGTSAGHQAFRDAYSAMFDQVPANDGATFGWVAEYPIKTALEGALADGDLTRANIAAQTKDMTVDYEGMVAESQFGGTPNDTVTRETTIGRPDDAATLKLGTVETGYVGPTAKDYDFSKPCVELG